MRNLAVGFAVGAGVGAGGCYIYISSVYPRDKSADLIWPAADPARKQAALEFGTPQSNDVLRVCDGYAAAYDLRTRTPKWVIEHITASSLEGDANRSKSKFFADPNVDPLFRASLDAYKESGYDRGHMAPAGDNKSSQRAMNETFSLSNVCPQVGQGFKRDYWGRFEQYVRDLTKKVDSVYVVTGPLWLPKSDVDGKWIMQHPMIGKALSLVSVPTHFYKVVLTDGRAATGGYRQVGVGAFVMPNAVIDPRIPLSAFTVPLEPLEQLAGARFFPAFINDTRRSAVDSAAQIWRQHGLQQLKPFERISLGQDMAALPESTSSASGGGPPLLTAGSGKTAPAPNNTAAAQATLAALAPEPKTRGAAGAIHLCEIAGCKLPEAWSGKKELAQKEPTPRKKAGGGGGGGGRRGGREQVV